MLMSLALVSDRVQPRYVVIGASSRILPASTCCITSVAVIVLVIDAQR
jgi:hypothetical protein